MDQNEESNKPQGEPQRQRMAAGRIAPREGSPIIFADSTNINAGYLGFKLTFGTVLPKMQGSTEADIVQDHVTIGMSPEHVQVLHDVLEAQLERYVEHFGPIRPKPGADDLSETVE